MPSEFGELLRRLRQAANLSQEALAEAARISVSAVGAYERGINSAPHRETVTMLAGALDLAGSDLEEFQQVARRKPRASSDTKSTALPFETFPPETSSFLGRDADVGNVEEMLRRFRCITITGTGGIGKTRVALRVGRRATAYRDGSVFVDLGAIAEPALIGAKVASALGVSTAKDPAPETLSGLARNKHLLVILDNCEHLLDAVGKFASALVRNTDNITILATSRERLRVTGEAVYRLSALPQDVSQALFVDRVTNIINDFTATSDRADIIADICRKLDGIPLALELAASRVATLGLRTLQTQLGDQLAVLSSGVRDVPSRQRTIDATFAWSVALLEPRERIAFRRLGVFAGGWTAEAAEEVCADAVLPRAEILDALSILVDKSLVGVNLDFDPPRYAMLRVAKMFANAQARDEGELALTAGRHAEWMAARAQRAHVELNMARRAWHDRYDIDIDNMRAAIEWGLAAGGDPALAVAIITGFIQVWSDNGQIAEHQRWTERALERTDPISNPCDVALLLRMLMKTGIGNQGIAAGERAIALFRSLDDAVALAHTLGAQASLQLKASNVDSAVRSADEAAQLYNENGLSRTLPFAFIMTIRAAIAANRGDFVDAERATTEAIGIAKDVRDEAFISYAQTLRGGFAFLSGDTQLAIGIADEALAVARRLGFRHDEMLLLCNRACYHLAVGDGDVARAGALFALKLARDNDPALVSTAIQHIASSCVLSRETTAAARLFGYTEEFRRRAGLILGASDARVFETMRAQLQMQVEVGTFEELLREGARLSADEAIEEALAATHDNERLVVDKAEQCSVDLVGMGP
jgi:predicted ATPase/DNA-binding XRE family transcriptional regulator